MPNILYQFFYVVLVLNVFCLTHWLSREREHFGLEHADLLLLIFVVAASLAELLDLCSAGVVQIQAHFKWLFQPFLIIFAPFHIINTLYKAVMNFIQQFFDIVKWTASPKHTN